MTERIPRLVGLVATILVASASLAAWAGTASAAEVAYNNLNTVAPTVNGLPNEDTYSEDSEKYSPNGFGGMVEFADTASRIPKTLSTQLDVFTCEHGIYSLDNCFTLKPTKKFSMPWTVKIYAAEPDDAPGALVASSTATFRLRYRPTTNTSCPSTEEGRGYGANCDVGGLLQTIKFKHFTPARAILPSRAIILLTAATSPIVNVGLQASYKEFANEQFVEEPAQGAPERGSDPLPEDAYVNGALSVGGHQGQQPVFKVTVR